MKKILVLIFVFFPIFLAPALADTITVTSNATDTVAPVINSYSFSRTTVQPGEPVNLTINATDNSEISMVWATFRWPNSSSANYTAFLSEGINQNGIYTVQFNSTGALGFYTVTYVFVNDSQSNISFNFSVLTFSVETATVASTAGPSFGGGTPKTKPEEVEAEEEALPTPPPSEKCTENWVCSDWSECIDGTRTRTCTDTNNCGTTANKPPETEGCIPPVLPEEQVPLGVPLGVWPVLTLLISALIVYIFVKNHNKGKSRIKHLKRVKL